MKNCINCGAPMDLKDNHCSYCGTPYYDLCCLELDELQPIAFRVTKDNATYAFLARPTTFNLNHQTDFTYACGGPHNTKLCSVPIGITANLDVGFNIIPDEKDHLFTIQIKEE